MRTTIFAAAAATLLFATPALAQADLKGQMRGTMTCDAHGQVEVITTATGQLVKFDPQFDIEEDRPALVQHHNTSTGRTTTLGALKSHDGPQTYVVPKGVTVSQEDHIIIFNPELDDDVASVELAE